MDTIVKLLVQCKAIIKTIFLTESVLYKSMHHRLSVGQFLLPNFTLDIANCECEKLANKEHVSRFQVLVTLTLSCTISTQVF